MKLTERTSPQARNYQCDKCKSIKCHKDMYDENTMITNFVIIALIIKNETGKRFDCFE